MTQPIVGRPSHGLTPHDGSSVTEKNLILKVQVGYTLQKPGGRAPGVASIGGQAPGSQHAWERPGH
jgi:hypothetical protein